MSRVRSLRYLLASLPGLVVLGLAMLGGLCATESGSRWLLSQLRQQMPGELDIARIDGTLLGGLSISGIDYTLDADRLRIAHLDIRWEPAALLTGTLRVGPLTIRDAAYRSTATGSAPDLELPGRIALPLAITLEAARIDGLQIVMGEQRLQFDTIELEARAGPLTGLRLQRLRVLAQDLALQASGVAGLRQPYPFHVQLDWSSVLPEGVPVSGQGSLEGDRRRLTLSHRLMMGAAQVETRGTLNLVEQHPLAQLSGHWQLLQWPLAGAADYSSRAGDYTIEGAPDAFRFTLGGDLTGTDLPPLTVRAQGHGDTRRLVLEPLTLAGLDGRLEATGTAAWVPEPALDLQVQADGLNPGLHWPAWPGRVAGTTRIKAGFGGQHVRLTLQDIDVHGRLRDYPLTIQGGLGLANERFSTAGLQISSGANHITLSGALDAPDGLAVQVTAPEPAAFWPGLGGQLEAAGRLQGTLAQPAGHGRFDARGFAYGDVAADLVSGQFTIDARHPENSKADVQATRVRIAESPGADVTLRASGWLTGHRLVFEAGAEAGTARLELDGRYRTDHWEGELEHATFDLRSLGEWRLHRPLALQATATRLEPLAGCWSAGAAEACVQGDWNVTRGWQATAQLTALPLQPLAALWEVPVSILGDLDAELSASGSAQGLQARLEARSGTGEIRLQAPEGETYQSRYQDAHLTARYVDTAIHLEAGTQLEAGTVQGRLTVTGLDAAVPNLDGVAEADLPDIRFVNGLVPDIEITGGSVRLQGRVDGRLDAPRLSGQAVLEQGSARLPGLGLTLEAVRLHAEGQGRRVALNGVLHSGRGELVVSGDLDLDPGADWPFELALRGTDIDVVQLPDIEVSASPDLTLRGSLALIDIGGRVLVPRARIRVRELPASVVRVSPDQVIVGAEWPAEGEGLRRIPVRVKVLATLGDDVRFEGLGLVTGLHGAVDIRSLQNGVLAGNGVVNFAGGRYEGYGQRLGIERGRLLFAGPLGNPDLDIRATRTVGQVVAGIELGGTLENPETRLVSDPAMPDAEILSYIVTGKPLSSASGGNDSQALAAAAASLGANSPVAAEIQRTLGVDIGTKSGATDEETAVTVGKQVTSRLYVDYLYGLFTETATLQFIYRLTDHFSLLGETGAEQAIDLRFTIERD